MESCDIFKTLDSIDDLPTLPAIAMKVNELLEDCNTSINELSDTIEKDQSIASKLLKLVNSTFFGLRSNVGNIPHALTLLGFNTVRNAVVSLSVIDAFGNRKMAAEFNISEFWTHSVAVAVTSRYLAAKTGLKSPDQSFIGGLLHDIGKVVLASYFPDHIEQIWQLTKSGKLSFWDAEREKGFVDHARIGGYLTEKWRLPPGLVDTIKNHHRSNPDAYDPSLQMIVQTADNIINRLYSANGKSSLSPASFGRVSGVLKSEIESLPKWFPKVSREIETAYRFFTKDGKR